LLHAVNVNIPFSPTVKIIPLGCVHWPHTNRSLLQEWIDRLSEPNTYGILLGDTFEFARTTTRRYMRAYVGDDTSFSEIDKYVNQEVVRLAKRLGPVRDKIIGAIRGNHYYTFQGLGGINSEQLLCQELGVQYLGAAGVVRIDLREPTNEDKVRDNIVLWLHHHGGSRATTPSGDVAGLMKQTQKLRADIYIIAHTHDCYARVEMERVVSNATPPTLYEEDRCFVRAGCLRENVTRRPDASLPDEIDYADEAGYSPRRNGFVEVSVNYTRNRGSRRNRRLKVAF
jgi:hypothetical protein